MEFLFVATAILALMAVAGLLYQWIPLWIRPKRPDLSLNDLIGHDAIKTALRDSVLELLDPSLPASALAHSILLYGPHNVGKKTLARAAAGYGVAMGKKLTFYELDCRRIIFDSEFAIVSSKISHALRTAKRNQPSIVLISNLEAINDCDLMQFVSAEIEKLENERVLLLGTTSVNEATAGHKFNAFPVQIEIDLPNSHDRETIVKSWLKSSENRCCYDLSKMALELQGCNYSEIISALSYAAFLSKKDGRSVINETDFVHSLYFRNSVFEASTGTAESTRIAYHEAGHALCHHALNNGMLLRVSAYPVSGHQAGGFTKPYLPETATTKMNILGVLAATLAGRAAEEIAYGAEMVSNGCFDDLRKARQLVRSFLDHGFGEKLSGVDKSEVDSLLDHAYGMALAFLKDHQQDLEQLVKLLLQNFSLSGDDVANTLSDSHAIPTKEELDELFGEDDFDFENYMVD